MSDESDKYKAFDVADYLVDFEDVAGCPKFPRCAHRRTERSLPRPVSPHPGHQWPRGAKGAS